VEKLPDGPVAAGRRPVEVGGSYESGNRLESGSGDGEGSKIVHGRSVGERRVAFSV
jgi:hypothetical protein